MQKRLYFGVRYLLSEERPLLPPLLTSAHQLNLSFVLLGGQHFLAFSAFADLSLSMMEDSRSFRGFDLAVLSSFDRC